MVGAPLVVENIRKEYRSRNGQSLVAVDGVSFAVKEGECFGLLGPNGAGKSTTINCITGFFPLNSGRITVCEHDVHREPKAARYFLGVCPQEETLDTDFDIWDQMIRHATFFGIPKKRAAEKAAAILEQFRILDRKKDLVESLSGGMRRRLQVARALMSDPKVLVLDEPTTGLDPDARRTLWDVIVDRREKGLAILLSTHYMEEAERLCDRIAILHEGHILDIDTPQALISRHVKSEMVEEELRPGIKWKRKANLEDVFLGLTGRALEGT